MSDTDLDDAPTGQTVEAAPPEKKKRSNLVPALVLAVGMVAAAFLLRPAPGAAGADATTTTEASGPAVALDPMTLNLRDGRFLRIGVAIELGESADAAEFEEHGASNRLKDLIIFEVSELDAERLSSSEGLDQLKDTLAAGAEKLYGSEFHDLYLTDLVIQ